MKAFVPEYELEQPRELKQALEKLAEGTWKPLSGGTDLMVLFESGKLPTGKYLSLNKLHELKSIRTEQDFLRIGACATYTQIRKDPVVLKEFPNLAESARETGAIAIQNRGTLGGNIANASPAADSPPSLLSYDADIRLISQQGERWIPYLDFHQGYKKTMLQPGELIAEIRLPRKFSDWKHHYRKVGTRRAQAITKVGFAATAQLDPRLEIKDVRLSWTSVAAVPYRAKKTESFLRGKLLTHECIQGAAHHLHLELAPIDDIRSTREYRLTVAQNLLKEFLELCGTG